MTALEAIRKKCIDCKGFQVKEVRTCDFTDCPLHRLRMGHGSRSALKPIRSYCLWRCVGQKAEVRLCPSKKCSLWHYRFGRRPQTTRLLPKIALTDGVSGTKGKRLTKVTCGKGQ